VGAQEIFLLSLLEEDLIPAQLAPMRVALVLLPPRAFSVADDLSYQILGAQELLLLRLLMEALAHPQGPMKVTLVLVWSLELLMAPVIFSVTSHQYHHIMRAQVLFLMCAHPWWPCSAFFGPQPGER